MSVNFLMFVVVLQVPLLFDYYYFSVLDMIVHANVVSLGLPNWRSVHTSLCMSLHPKLSFYLIMQKTLSLTN